MKTIFIVVQGVANFFTEGESWKSHCLVYLSFFGERVWLQKEVFLEVMVCFSNLFFEGGLFETLNSVKFGVFGANMVTHAQI